MKKLIAIVLMAVVALGAFTACHKKEKEPEISDSIAEATEEVKNITQEAMETVKPMETVEAPKNVLENTSWVLTASDVGEGEITVSSDEKYLFKENGVLTLETQGVTYEGTYNINENSGNIVVEVGEDKAEFDFEVDGDKLTTKIKSRDQIWKYIYTKQN